MDEVDGPAAAPRAWRSRAQGHVFETFIRRNSCHEEYARTAARRSRQTEGSAQQESRETSTPGQWFALWQDADVSLATEDDATIALLRQAMADDRDLIAKGLMTQAEYDQEWFLSPEAAIKGAWFGTEMAALAAAAHICNVPHDPALPVDTDWDFGIDDATVIWFSQSTRSGEARLIDYYEGRDEGLTHYVHVLHERGRTCGYTYGKHWAPHDVRVREFSTGKSRVETAQSLGLKFEIVPAVPFADGVNAVRLISPRCWFD